MTFLTENFIIQDLKPRVVDFRASVLKGLGSRRKYVPPKFFYDHNGSVLFEKITSLEEYYLTRSEMSIISDHGHELKHIAGRKSCLMEFGGGNLSKGRIFINLLSPEIYVPIDISKEFLCKSAMSLASELPDLTVWAVCADFMQSVEVPGLSGEMRKTGLFLGSSLGNFEPDESRRFFMKCSGMFQRGDSMVIGVDRKKDKKILERAYNDSQGITAQFNLNLLHRINGNLDGNLDPDNFYHKAFYNEAKGRIEMHLVCRNEATYTVAGSEFHFSEGESIHTENSYKFSREDMEKLIDHTGFEIADVMESRDGYFSLYILRRI